MSSADTLPAGRFYTEPYIFDSISQGQHRVGSLTYIQYGLHDEFTVGVLPRFWILKRSGKHTLVPGDMKLLAQLRLSRFDPEKHVPSMSLIFQRTLLSGRHDNLAPGDEAAGSGASSTSIGLNLQHYFWMPNGRLLRGRINLLGTYPERTNVRGRSAYGTDEGFRGEAKSDPAFSIGASLEYSVTRSVVLAMDVVHDRSGATRLRGSDRDSSAPVAFRIPSSRSITISPAVEYSWSPREGLLVGFLYSPSGANSPRSITPVVAFSRFW